MSALLDFHVGHLSLQTGIYSVGFCGGRKTREPEEKPSKQGKNQQQTQPTYDTKLESNLHHNGGRQVLSALYHPYSPFDLLDKMADSATCSNIKMSNLSLAAKSESLGFWLLQFQEPVTL